MTKKQPTSKVKDKSGRKIKTVDFDQLKKLCEIHCTKEEIIDFFEVSCDTLTRRVKELGYLSFADYYTKNISKGKISLKRKQWDVAMDGDGQMLRWLGKQNLGQKERVENENHYISDEVMALSIKPISTGINESE